jgi:hypothetical protein
MRPCLRAFAKSACTRSEMMRDHPAGKLFETGALDFTYFRFNDLTYSVE